MKIFIEPADLRPIIELVVTETLARVDDDRPGDDRLAYTEAEAATMVGLDIHVLREQRRLGRIKCCKAKPGRRILYTPSAIRAFLDGGVTDA